MKPQTAMTNDPIFYLTILLVIDALVIVFSLAGKQSGIIFNILILLALLAAAQCCKSPSWAALYSLLSMFFALIMLDPVGLWIVGHGDQKNRAQNAFCVLAFLLKAITAYIGYLYKISLQSNIQSDFTGREAAPRYNNPNENNQPNYLFSQGDQPSRPEQAVRKAGFEHFSGQAYSLS